ncbi:T9SS type A sorting domain-containing protein [Hymenobacter negativus]|uniref:T9SS type A sorting domain-containing protein n=1 Tax=Hymenobacter negativus TaxID=2795026 RepID=A0ABS3QHS7_9BACT|nr:T9SS type A sorting domain-containing protein [Hymenobacter negativus]MBO2010800.1 T9SS type A sorting domain-containing protein [Hymenobacter negativus]
MKKFYWILLLTGLGIGLPATVVQAQLTISGPVTLYIGPGGLMAMPSYLTVGTGATLTNEGQLDFGGDLTNNGIVTAPVTSAAQLRVMGAAGLQNLTGSATLPVQNLTVNNAAGVAVAAPINVAGTITLTNGLVTIGSSTPITLLTTATDPVETNSARLVGPVTMAARSVGGGAFGPFLGLTMPAGGGNVGSITLTRVTGPTGITTVGGNSSAAVYWTVASSAGGNPKRKMYFSWLSALDNGRNMAQATPWRSDAPYTVWTQADGPTTNVSASNPRQYNPGAANTEDVVGRFTMSDVATPLPVELTAFTARREGVNARLDWNTASEKSNDYFDVERSRDGLEFEPAGRVAGQGSSTVAHDYSFLDPKVAQYGVPTLYYRLRQVDKEGTVSYSTVRTVAVESASALLVSAWPNPSAGAGPHIRVEQPGENALTATLTDATGRQLAVYHTTSRLSEGLFATETAALASGVYLLRVTTTGTSQVLKLVRE